MNVFKTDKWGNRYSPVIVTEPNPDFLIGSLVWVLAYFFHSLKNEYESVAETSYWESCLSDKKGGACAILRGIYRDATKEEVLAEISREIMDKFQGVYVSLALKEQEKTPREILSEYYEFNRHCD